MKKLLRGNILPPLILMLLGACAPLRAQTSGTENGGPATPVPTFQPPAVVVPSAGQESDTTPKDQATDTDGEKTPKENGKRESVGGVSPFASPQDDYIPVQAPVTPQMRHEVVDSGDLYTIHLRPLFTTAIKLPEEVVAIAVGAPSLVWAEHDKKVPQMVFVKPTTNAPINSDIIVTLKSGATLTIHVISDGEKGSKDPVDFMVDYSGQNSLLRGEAQQNGLFRNVIGEESADLEDPTVGYAAMDPPATAPVASPKVNPASTALRPASLRAARFDPATAAAAGVVRTSNGLAKITVPSTLLESLYQEQVGQGAPVFLTGTDLSHIYAADKKATSDLAVSIGRMVQRGDTMTFSFSVVNRSSRWIEIMPPHLEFADPKPHKPSKKHPTSVAEQLTVNDYILTATKLAPGQRIDGAIQFERPSFKYKKQLLMLQVASAAEVDTALLLPVPFTTQYGTN